VKIQAHSDGDENGRVPKTRPKGQKEMTKFEK
jgi:hypothetical protein